MKMKTATVSATLLLLLPWAPLPRGAATTEGAPAAHRDGLEETVRRFFAEISSYHQGDLIVQSQVEDLQDYLRKTHRRSRATQPVLLKRVLPDRSQLARFFYTAQGGSVLRSAAEKLGTYAGLDHLSRTSTGRHQISEAIHSGRADQLVEILTEKNPPADRTAGGHSKNVPLPKRRIYTVQQFLLAAQPQNVPPSTAVIPRSVAKSP